jgi:hypothetical protein
MGARRNPNPVGAPVSAKPLRRTRPLAAVTLVDRRPIRVGPTPEGFALVRAIEALEAGVAGRRSAPAVSAAPHAATA